MLTDDQLMALLADLESDRVERTVATKDTDKFGEAVCAFANDLPDHREPGYLLIGVKDDGTPSGLTVTDELLRNLAAIRSDGNVLPQPALHVSKRHVPGGDIAVVEVLPSDLPPVRYKGRVWVRIGPRKAKANEQEERMLSERRISRAHSFDAHPCREAGLEDIALGQFDAYRRAAIDAETIAENHRDIEQQLASLRFYAPDHAAPTYAGILLFGKNPRFYLPGAYIQYLQFPGNDLTDLPEDQAELSGDLPTVVKELGMRIRVLVRTAMRPVGAWQEQLSSNYPEWALRELALNAIVHRNYESHTPIRFYAFADHIEIHNPGGLYGEATRENFPNRNSYRNPILAEAMKTLGFVNRYGYGVRRAQALLEKNGSPPAEFEFDDRTVLARIRKRPA